MKIKGEAVRIGYLKSCIANLKEEMASLEKLKASCYIRLNNMNSIPKEAYTKVQRRHEVEYMETIQTCVKRLAELTTLLCRYKELLKVEMNNLELPKRIEESARKKF